MHEATGAAEIAIVIEALTSDQAVSAEAETVLIKITAHFRPPHGAVITEESETMLDLRGLRAHEQSVSTYGRLLGDQLVVGKIATLLARAEGDIGRHVKIRLHISREHPAIAVLRWERIILPGKDTPLALNSAFTLVRVATSSIPWAAPAQTLRRARILLAVACPTNLTTYQLDPFDLDGETARARFILEYLYKGSVTILATARSQEGIGVPATIEAIQAALDTSSHQVVYILSHCTVRDATPILWLENRDSSVARVDAPQLIRALTTGKHKPDLVVLASCHSAGIGYAEEHGLALAPALVQAGVPYVIGMQGYLTPDNHQILMRTLFEHLRDGASIEHAVTIARRALKDHQEWWAPVLYIREVRAGPAVSDPRGSLVKPIEMGEDAATIASMSIEALLEMITERILAMPGRIIPTWNTGDQESVVGFSARATVQRSATLRKVGTSLAHMITVYAQQAQFNEHTRAEVEYCIDELYMQLAGLKLYVEELDRRGPEHLQQDAKQLVVYLTSALAGSGRVKDNIARPNSRHDIIRDLEQLALDLRNMTETVARLIPGSNASSKH